MVEQLSRGNVREAIERLDTQGRVHEIPDREERLKEIANDYATKPGNRTAKTDERAGVTSNYTYDSIYELTKVVQGTNTTESYTFDPVGNRLSSLSVSPYSYNTSNELTSTPSTTYRFDYDGNTLTSVTGSNTTTYAWDFENRLTSVTLPGSGGTVTFKYDPFGRRIYKSSSTATSVYAYDEDNLIEETNASGAVVARYTQTEDFDEPLAMLRSSTTSYYQADDLGSITSLSNAAGALAQTYTFDSFGNQTASSGSLTNPFQYTARERDSETSLYFYRARYFDPNAGRFLSEDPLGIHDNVDMYVYVHNNPVNFNDPFGLYTLKGNFPPGYAQQLSNAIDETIKKLRDTCSNGGCAGPEGPKIADALSGATFVYHPKSKLCGDVGPFSVLRLHHVIAMGPAAFDPGSGCGPLTCTVAHEGVHLRTGGEGHAGDIEKKCFGCTD